MVTKVKSVAEYKPTRGIRFHLKDGTKIDTEELVNEELIPSDLKVIQEKLKEL